MRFIINLLPLLLASPLPAHVISVFAAGKEADFNSGDMSLRDPKRWGTLSVRSHVCIMHTFFFEHLAAQHPGKLSLVHLFPGMVMTNAFQNPGVPFWAKMMFKILGPLFRLISTPVPESGERTIFLASPQRFPARQEKGGNQSTAPAIVTGPKLVVATGTDGKTASGAYGVGIDGETAHYAKMIEKHRADGIGEKVVQHTMRSFEVISSGQVWTE